jgi:SAM-dependent methyltransferase
MKTFTKEQAIQVEKNSDHILEWKRSHGYPTDQFAFSSTPGQFNSEDVYAFFLEHADAIAGSHGGPIRIVEVGCYLGQSTLFLLEAIHSCYLKGVLERDVEIHVVDTFEGATDMEKEHANNESGSFLSKFEHHLGPLLDRVNVHVGKSLDVVNDFEDDSIDFVFIDADHSYEEVYKDINAWYEKVQPYGALGGHDWHDPGVRTAYAKTFYRPPTLVVSNSWMLLLGKGEDKDARGDGWKYVHCSADEKLPKDHFRWCTFLWRRV